MSDFFKRFVILLVAVFGLVNTFDALVHAEAGTDLLAYRHPPSRIKEFQEITTRDLPPEARNTLVRIRKGGPFPYPQDATVFRNREGRLPGRPQGYYREYTVKTPGARDRGGRRIIAGQGGEFYYTSDHYRTFKLIKE
jgi:ribonuclease T1